MSGAVADRTNAVAVAADVLGDLADVSDDRIADLRRRGLITTHESDDDG